jgi:hypothetical protein
MQASVIISHAGGVDIGESEDVSGITNPVSAVKSAMMSALAKHPTVNWTSITITITK